MKTIEEAAEECSNSLWGDCLDAAPNSLIDAFKAGVEFAQRWIPVEEDLPEKDDCESCLWKNSGGIWFGTARQSDKPTHWRPIELK